MKMTIGEVAQVITATAALGAVFLSWNNSRKIQDNSRKIEEVHVATNSLTDRLIASTALASEAKGRKDMSDEIAARS